MSDDDALRVHVAGAQLSGFQRGEIALSMDELTATFSLEYAVADDAQAPLGPGDAVQVRLGDELLVAGYVDSIDIDDMPEQLSRRASGRSKTADLVDCSAEQSQLRGKTALGIARALAEPYGVQVELAGAEGEAFSGWSVQRGESVADAILRTCLKRGLYAYAVGDHLVLGRAGSLTTATQLVRGQPPLLSSSYTHDWMGRFSLIVYRGQLKATDRVWGKGASQLKHAVHDAAMPRYRPLLLQAEAHSSGDLQQRAEVELRQRRGRSEHLSAQVAGHRTVEGYTWRPNLLVHVTHPIYGIDEAWLVTGVVLRFGYDQPRATQLTLSRPDAYLMDSDPALKRATKKGK